MPSIPPFRHKFARTRVGATLAVLLPALAPALFPVLCATVPACSAAPTEQAPAEVREAGAGAPAWPAEGGAREGDAGAPVEAGDAAPGDAPGDASSTAPVVRVGDVLVQSLADARALAGVNVVTGELRVERASLVDLRELASLREVGGALIVRGNAALASLAGLESLASVGGDLVLEENAALTDVAALRELATVGGALRIGSNQTAVLDPVTKAFRGVTPEADNAGLTAIAFPKLLRAGSLAILRNPRVATLSFPKLARVSGSLEISYCPQLTDLSNSFLVLEAVAGGVTVGRFRPTYHVITDAGPAAASVPAAGNDRLAVVEFPNLQIATNVEVVDNPVIESVSLVTLHTLDGKLKVSGPSVDVRKLTSVIDAVELYGTTTLVSPSLARIGGLILSGTKMPSLGPLSALSRVGTITIMNSELLSLRGLESLTSADSISISRSPLLTTTDGLDGLEVLRGDLVLQANSALVDVHLPKLTRATAIMLQSNRALATVRFEELTGPLDSFVIDTCRAVTTLHAPKLANVTSFGVSGRGSRIANFELGALTRVDGLSLADGPTSLAPFLTLTQLGSLYVRTRHVPQAELDAFVAALASKGVTPTDVDVRYSAPAH